MSECLCPNLSSPYELPVPSTGMPEKDQEFLHLDESFAQMGFPT